MARFEIQVLQGVVARAILVACDCCSHCFAVFSFEKSMSGYFFPLFLDMSC